MKNLGLVVAMLIAGSVHAEGIKCQLWYGDKEVNFAANTDPTELLAANNGFASGVSAWRQDGNFSVFNVELVLPNVKVIRAVSTRDSLAKTDGWVLRYMNNSKLDEVAVTCQAK